MQVSTGSLNHGHYVCGARGAANRVRCVFRRLGFRGICEMVSDGGGRLIPAHIVRVYTLSLLLSSRRVAHDRATEDNHAHRKVRQPGTERLVVGTVHKPRQRGIKSIPL